MNRSALMAILIIVALLGFADSWYLAASAFSGSALACTFAAGLDGCNIVAQSPYSRFFGIPLAAYGVAFYAFFIICVAVIWKFPKYRFFQLLTILGGMGLVASIYFESLQIFVIKAICIYCAGSFVASLVLLVLAIVLQRLSCRPGGLKAPLTVPEPPVLP